MRQSMKLPSSHIRSAGWLPSVASPAHRCRRGARIDAQAQHSTAPVEESSADNSELEEIEALRLENERLRLRAREIGAKLPEKAIVSDVLNDVVASLPGREEPTEQQSIQPLAAQNSESRTIDPQVDAPSFADKSHRIVKNGVSSPSNGARSQSAAVSSVSHQSAPMSSPSSESNGSSSSPENGSSAANPPRSTDNGAYSTYEVSSQPGADTSSLSPAGRKKSHEWQVLSAERLGLYASPHNSFPSELPTDELVPKGTVPNFLPPSNETGLLRRIPQSEDELLQELEELELKNPSASLQALRETVKNFGSEEVGEKHIKFNQKALGSMLHNLVFVSAEAAPYSKTGGLGDVVGSLTVALAERGHRVMVVCPRYITTARDRKLMARLHDCQTWVKVDLGNGEHWVNFHHEARGGVDWVFVEHVSFERPGGLYGNNQGIYADNLFRFALLSQAACEASLQLQLPQYASVHEHWKTLQNRSEKVVAPAQYPDVIGEHKCAIFGEEVTFVANDWHAGLVPLYLNHKYKPHGVFDEARTLVAIHNLAHQGTALAHEFPIFNLPQSAYHELEWIYEEPDGRRTPVVNIMKAALLAADSIVTVSETYAWQITREEHGVGLHSILQARRNRLVGILNGMDTTSWDPATDPHLPMNYSPVDLTGKAYCKAALRRKLGLPEAEYGVDVPLVGFVGRLDPQKGPDIIISALSGLLALDCQIVMLGSGHPHLEQQMKKAERDHPDFFRGVVQFSEPLAHEIMAASDILLMPSRFEPCGLNQMHAMRYGTVPIAHATGGLQDTVLDVTPFAQGTTAHGTGWTFSPASDDAMIAAVKAAVQVYRDNGERWQNIQLAGMNSDWGWGHAAQSYESVVRSVLAPVDER